MRALARTIALWLAVGTLVVLVSRWIAYRLAPSPLAMVLEHDAGGPRLLVVAAIALGLAFFAGAAVVALAALAVHEQGLLETRPLLTRPRLRLVRLALRTLALWVAA